MNSMRSVVRASAYMPASSSGVRRVAAPDEDAFTLGATAVETAWEPRERTKGPVSIHLVGEFPAMSEWGFPAVIGHPGEVTRHSGDWGELTKTIRSLEGAGDGPALVVAAELPERAEERDGRGPIGPGAAAVALLFEDRPDGEPYLLEQGKTQHPPAAGLLAGGRPGRERTASTTYVGDWEGNSRAGHPVDLELVRRAAERDPNAVSEGAYVPRARYLENLPSRWRLIAEECGVCHGITFPARGACRRCGRRETLTPLSLPRDGGRVLAVTTIGKGGQPTEFDAQVEASGPYQVALVELARGVRLTLQVADADPGTVKVGDKVRTLLRRLYPMEGEWRYGRKAAPHPAETTRLPDR